jgi:hypothetical protein
MAAVVPDEAVEEVAVIAPLDGLGAAIRARCEARLQRVGFYSLGPIAGLDDETQAEIVRQIRG